MTRYYLVVNERIHAATVREEAADPL